MELVDRSVIALNIHNANEGTANNGGSHLEGLTLQVGVLKIVILLTDLNHFIILQLISGPQLRVSLGKRDEVVLLDPHLLELLEHLVDGEDQAHVLLEDLDELHCEVVNLLDNELFLDGLQLSIEVLDLLFFDH